MKKLLFILAILASVPAYSLCSITNGESICTLTNSTNVQTPLFQQQNTNLNQTQTQIQMPNNSNSLGRTQNKKGIQMQGSLSCQFGNCNYDSESTFLPNQ